MARTIAGFLNAKGGTLFIGVNDDGNVVGLARDFKSLQKRPDRDGFENWLTGMLRQRLGVGFFGRVEATFLTFEGREVCRIDVEPSSGPLFVDETRFFVRVGNSTQELQPAQMLEYLEGRGMPIPNIPRSAAEAQRPSPREEDGDEEEEVESADDDLEEIDDVGEDDALSGGESWPHEKIRLWVQSEFLARAVDEFEDWLLQQAGNEGRVRHRRRTRHSFILRGRRLISYRIARRWIYFWLPFDRDDDFEAFQRLSAPERVHRHGDGISGRVETEEDLDILKERLLVRLGDASWITQTAGASRRHYGVHLEDLVAHGLLDEGQRLRWHRPTVGETHWAVVLPGGAGLETEGHTYTSPSAAAVAIAGRPIDGWQA